MSETFIFATPLHFTPGVDRPVCYTLYMPTCDPVVNPGQAPSDWQVQKQLASTRSTFFYFVPIATQEKKKETKTLVVAATVGLDETGFKISLVCLVFFFSYFFPSSSYNSCSALRPQSSKGEGSIGGGEEGGKEGGEEE